MKKATYTLTIEYTNGDKSMRGGLTQTDCYRILGKYRDNGWIMGDHLIKGWMISSGWQKCGASL
jgi:hypothetical protein